MLKPLGLQEAARSYSEISAYKIIRKYKDWANVSPDFEILEQSFVHKCSYKYQKDLLKATIKNNLQHFLSV